jgi:hypothetical protein
MGQMKLVCQDVDFASDLDEANDMIRVAWVPTASEEEYEERAYDGRPSGSVGGLFRNIAYQSLPDAFAAYTALV